MRRLAAASERSAVARQIRCQVTDGQQMKLRHYDRVSGESVSPMGKGRVQKATRTYGGSVRAAVALQHIAVDFLAKRARGWRGESPRRTSQALPPVETSAAAVQAAPTKSRTDCCCEPTSANFLANVPRCPLPESGRRLKMKIALGLLAAVVLCGVSFSACAQTPQGSYLGSLRI